MTDIPHIQLTHISKTYDAHPAVQHVSFDVSAGEMLVLLGSSGCGKTTLLRLIAGLERPDGGQIALNGKVVTGVAWVPAESRRVGMVFQDYALFPHMTVAQNITFGLQGVSRTDQRSRVADMLDLVGLNGLDGRYPHQLSGGQQQRVALARALAPSPTVVLLDEPFSNLDAALRRTMREDVRRILREADETAVFVTHDQEEAMSLADRVAVMQAGHLLQIDTPHTLYHQPTSPDVAEFIGAVNWLPATAHGHTAETAFGDVTLHAEASGSVRLMTRPEAFTLEPNADSAAVVESVRFYGTHHTATVRLADGDAVAVRRWSHEPLTVGEHVRVRYEGRAVAFPIS